MNPAAEPQAVPRALWTRPLSGYHARTMSSATHSYYDWQVSTLLLAYDAVDPISRDDVEALAKRQQDVELELHKMVHATLPPDYLSNPARDFPPEVVIDLTRATLRRAAAIVGLL
jgi:hypothetical protein